MRPPSDIALGKMSDERAVHELTSIVRHYLRALSDAAREYAQNAPLDLDDDLVTWMQTEAEYLRDYVDEIDDAVMERKRQLAHDRKIRSLRLTNGRTAAEIETGKRLADRLEAKRDATSDTPGTS